MGWRSLEEKEGSVVLPLNRYLDGAYSRGIGTYRILHFPGLGCHMAKSEVVWPRTALELWVVCKVFGVVQY